MAVSSRYRWVAVGSLNVRNRLNAAENAPDFQIADLIAALNDRIANQTNFRFYSNENRVMWCSHLVESDDFYELLLQTGDKDVSGFSFFHFENREFRDIDKEEDEGGHYSAHVLISKAADIEGRHPTLVEKVPGIFLGSVRDYFTWACHDPSYEKEAEGPDGKPRQYRAIFDIDGYRSRTIGDALAEGVLTDIEFVSIEEDFALGHDELPIVDEVVRQAKWKIGKKVTEEVAQGIFGKAKEFFADFSDDPTSSQTYVRIKTENGQVKRTEIDLDNAQMLEQSFIQNEVVSDFNEPLPARYATFHPELVAKVRELGAKI
ncbi:hypothetical protein GRI42_02380 [Erythrobacter gaetbuli]|uniref:Uncharacterized protein n=1 Tax=Qipengyuania gaetbuli TaxID=266952 RepID=A0A844XXT0_9SPHN|nr:hypothetical protein [Qipengyuania gaetbuli]MXO50149.1 hypothetical protein [Qipengyuania gaetbuli]